MPLNLEGLSGHAFYVGNHDQGQKIAAAAYLKNLSRRNIDGEFPCSNVSKGFKDDLLRALFQVEPKVLKVLLEVVIIFLAYPAWLIYGMITIWPMHSFFFVFFSYPFYNVLAVS